MPQLNLVDIENYLTFLAPNPKEIFSFCFLDKDSKHQIPGLGIKFSTCTGIIDFLRGSGLYSDRLEGLDYTLHVALNHTSTAGRKASDVKSVRCLCLDIDIEIEREKLKTIVKDYDVHLVVESSPNKYHIYWRIDETIPLQNWITYQLGVANMFSGDYGMSGLSHTVRVPGIERRCKDGTEFLPRVVWLKEIIVPLSEVDIGRTFKGIKKHAEAAKAEQKQIRTKLRDGVREAERSGDLSKVTAKGLGRNQTLYEAVLEWASIVRYDEHGDLANVVSMQEAIEFGKEVASQFEQKSGDPFTETEIDKTCISAYQIACERWKERVSKIASAGELLGAVCAADDEEVLFTGQPTHQEILLFGKNPFTIEFPGYTNGHHTEPDGSAVSAAKLGSYTPFLYDYTAPMLSAHRFSDMGVTARVLQRFGNQLVRVGKQLYAFDAEAKVWGPQSSREHLQLYNFMETCCLDVLHDPRFKDELGTTAKGEASETMLRKAKDRFTSGRMQQLVVSGVLNSSKVVALPKENFDASEHMLYVGNGVLNMLTGHVRDARAEDYLLNRASVEWDADASCPRWLTFIKQIYGAATDTLEMCMFVQELFGYSLSGSIAEQRLFLHHGDGCNGKSYLLSALARLLGSYATYLEPTELVRAKNGYDTKFERFGAKIEGKRVGILDDVDVKAVWNEGTVKNLTSDTLRARAEYEQSRVIMNRCKLHLGLNVAPSPEAENHGILRRLCFIPYGVRFEASAAKGRELDLMLKEELPGILRWAVKGYRRFHERGGLAYPADSLLAAAEYKDENFSLEGMVRDMFAPSSNPEETWSLVDLTEDVNKALSKAGAGGIRVTPQLLSGSLKRCFGVKGKKVWNPGTQNSQKAVNISLKYARSVPGDLL